MTIITAYFRKLSLAEVEKYEDDHRILTHEEVMT